MQHRLTSETAYLQPPRSAIPDFEPSRWLRGGHAQTIVGRYLPGPRPTFVSKAHEVPVSGGDRLVVLESVPPQWESGQPVAMLVHGLAGDADASYVIRLAIRLYDLGIRVVRVNLRGAGRGFGLARGIYHAGASDDLRAVAAWLAERLPGSPMAVAGFSLGASLALKLAREAAEQPVAGFDCVIAANPPIDLAACARQIQRRENRIYDKNFVRWLCAMVRKLHRHYPHLGEPPLAGVKTLYDFDHLYTAVRNGYASADDYYTRNSTFNMIPKIALPVLIVHALDDPFIPAEPFLRLAPPPNVQLELVNNGGHIGYVSRKPWLGDRRWLEARMATWLGERWQSNGMLG